MGPLPIHIPLDGERVYCLLSDSVIGQNGNLNISENDQKIISNAKSDLYERVATVSDEICEKYLINDEIPTPSELFTAINLAYQNGTGTPVLFGSSKNNLSVKELVEFQTKLGCTTISPLGGQPLALAFKLTNDRRLGEVVMLRNFGSEITGKSPNLTNLSDGGTSLKGMKIYQIWGNSFQLSDFVGENEVFVLAGNGKIRTGDIISHKKVQNINTFQNSIEARRPSCSVVLEVAKQGKEQVLG